MPIVRGCASSEAQGEFIRRWSHAEFALTDAETVVQLDLLAEDQFDPEEAAKPL